MAKLNMKAHNELNMALAETVDGHEPIIGLTTGFFNDVAAVTNNFKHALDTLKI